MPAKTNFGKRAVAQAPVSRATAARSAAAAPAPPQSTLRNDPFDGFYAGGIPVVTCALIALLVLIFTIEIRLTVGAEGAFSPNRLTLIALGGIDGKLTLGAQQWWRVFTAPMLHASLSHLLGNCLALFLAGLFLEPLIGAGWFGALFFVSALGGAAGSLAQNDPTLVSVGASGAISGLLAASLFFSYREKDKQRRHRMQLLTGRFLIPAVAPIFFPEGTTGGIDYGAHAGGAMAGILLCLALSAFWDKDAKRPAFQGQAMAATGLGAALTVLAFLLTGMTGGTYMAQAATLIPQNQIPHTGADGASRSAELVAKFPTDPRAHYYRALYFYGQHDLSAAADQLHTGIADLSAHSEDFKPLLGQTLKMTLAVIQNQQGDPYAARDTARDSCATAPPSALLDTLRREKICN